MYVCVVDVWCGCDVRSCDCDDDDDANEGEGVVSVDDGVVMCVCYE